MKASNNILRYRRMSPDKVRKRDDKIPKFVFLLPLDIWKIIIDKLDSNKVLFPEVTVSITCKGLEDKPQLSEVEKVSERNQFVSNILQESQQLNHRQKLLNQRARAVTQPTQMQI